MPFRYAWRTGAAAANTSPQATISASTAQKFGIRPMSSTATEPRPSVISSMSVRRRNSDRIAGVISPPTICAAASNAAASPAMPYAVWSPQRLSRCGCSA